MNTSGPGACRAPRRRCTAALVLETLCLLGMLAWPAAAGAQAERPMRILLTNDDGIDALDSRVAPVARELRPFAEVYIVVADQDRSGSSQFMSLARKVTLEERLEYVSEPHDGLNRLEIHVVDGFPADCVALGIGGIMNEDPPDLVISGPNDGANLGDAWFGSGTIGAARTAAYLGVPALAISGLDDDSEEQVSALARWVAELAQSEIVRSLPELTYLTVGLPRVRPSEVAGIRIARRARLMEGLFLQRVAMLRGPGEDDVTTSVWAVQRREQSPVPAPDSDMALSAQKYIVITPMRADEHDAREFAELQANLDRLPAWPPK